MADNMVFIKGQFGDEDGLTVINYDRGDGPYPDEFPVFLRNVETKDNGTVWDSTNWFRASDLIELVERLFDGKFVPNEKEES